MKKTALLGVIIVSVVLLSGCCPLLGICPEPVPDPDLENDTTNPDLGYNITGQTLEIIASDSYSGLADVKVYADDVLKQT